MVLNIWLCEASKKMFRIYRFWSYGNRKHSRKRLRKCLLLKSCILNSFIITIETKYYLKETC